MKSMVCLMTMVLSVLLVMPASATMRDSADFTGVMYEGEAVPTSTTPIWDRAASAYASSDGSLLAIDVLAAGSVGWHLPGQYGANWAPVGYRNYTQGDAANPWNPDFNVGYTLELSTQVLDSNPGQWGYSLYIGEAGGGALYDIQIFENLIRNGAGMIMYSGDLTGSQHQIRIVRNPGAMNIPEDTPSVDIYVDGQLSYSGGKTADGGILSNAGWDQDWIYMGSLSGAARYSVATDYLRMDFSGPYTPIPEPVSLMLLAGGAVWALRKRTR